MRDFVASRGIRNVLHFTRRANLPSILQHGIVPRDPLVTGQMHFEFNDAYRHDDHLPASCFTIGWPNYEMFCSARCDHPNVKWAVIECSPEVLWKKPCGRSRAIPNVEPRAPNYYFAASQQRSGG